MKEQTNKIVFLKGHKVILRPPNKETDLDDCLRWINDPEVRIFIYPYFPVLKEEEAEWFDKLKDKKDEIHLAIETVKEEKFIGIMGLNQIHWQNRTATTGAFIGEKDYWGKGYGTDAKMFLLDYAFNTLNLRKISSSVISFNKRSLNYSLHCGYKIEGRKKKQFFKDGRYYDEIILGLFKNNWLPIWKKYQKIGRIK